MVFLIMLFIATLYSAILIYHWRSYGENDAITASTTAIYLIGAACWLGGMGVATLMTF